MKPASLLRWYPRSWRERYGDELLALIQDSLDEGRPTWRLQLSAIWGGLRERGREARHAAAAPFRHPDWPARSGTILMAGLVCAVFPGNLASSSSPTRAWQAVTLDAALAAMALTGAVVLADGLAALPALVRFLRAGGGPKVWRQASWAAAATAVAGGGLAGLIVSAGSLTPAQLGVSLAYWTGALITGLATMVGIWLWATTATATARQLTLTPRVQAAQLVLGSVIPTAVTVVASTLSLWWSVTQGSVTLLVLAVVNLATASVLAPGRIGRAVRRGRRLRSGGRVATGRATTGRPTTGPRHAR
jgi:hypothetical protein